jgi:hypothetical protein
MSLDVLEIQDQQKQAVVRSDMVKFCYTMIREGAWEKDIPKIEMYLELVKKYSA